MIITRLIELLTGAVESFMFFMMFETIFERRPSVPGWIYTLAYILFAVVIDASFYIFYGTYYNIITTIVASLAVTFLYRCDIKERTAIPLIVMVINILMEMLTWYAVGMIYDLTSFVQLHDGSAWMTGAMISKAISMIIINFIRIRIKNRKLFFNVGYWLLFMASFLPMLLVDMLLFILTLNIDNTITQTLCIIASMGLIVSVFTILYLYERLSDQAEAMNREQQYMQQIKSQTKHLDEILVMQRKLKGFRHDIKNHWVALKGYFLNKDYDGGIKYIDEVSGAMTESESVDTGNIALDAIISTKKALAEEKNIEFTTRVQVPERMFVDAVDICVIFGNALDNAIEACEKTGNEEKKICLSVIYEDESVICKITNSVSGRKMISLKTTKSDKENHGFGFENIKKSLEKYNYVMKTEQENNKFILSFVIFGKQK